MKIKSFGLVEAMIASFIAITVLSGAVALSNSVNRSTTLDGSYSEAEKIADNFLENLSFANSQGRVFFNTRASLVDHSVAGDTLFSIKCFDSQSAASCGFPDFYANTLRTQVDADGYYGVRAAELGNASFSDGFFKIKTTVNHFVNSAGVDSCRTGAGVITISSDKCRVVDVEVKWSENVGDKSYLVSRYIVDWTR